MGDCTPLLCVKSSPIRHGETMANSIYGTNGWDRCRHICRFMSRRGQRISKGGGEISNVIVFKKILKNRPSRVLLQTTFCGRGGGEGPQPPPLSAYVCVSFFKLSSRQIYIVLSTLLFLSPSFALQPLHTYLTSFQIYSFYANSSFLEKFSIFFRVMTQNYICT